MSIKITKYLKGYRSKYSVDYLLQDDKSIHLFDFDEKEVFNTRETGTSSFYRSEIRNLLNEFKVFEKVQDNFNMEKNSFERMVIEAVEDYYEYEFKDEFYKAQYRRYIKKQKEEEVFKDMIRYEEEFSESFNDVEHFKKWYINLINYNYNTEFTSYNEAKRFQRSEGWKETKGEKRTNSFNLTQEEDELFQEVLKAGFTKLAKKYHPDVNGDNEKMQLLNSLKEKFKK